MLTNYPKLTDAEIGSNLSRPLLLSAIEENTDKNGNAYVKVTLKDGFSDVTAVMFSTSAADLEALLITVNTVVDADLAVSEYQGNKSYKVSNLAPAADIRIICTISPTPLQQTSLMKPMRSTTKQRVCICSGNLMQMHLQHPHFPRAISPSQQSAVWLPASSARQSFWFRNERRTFRRLRLRHKLLLQNCGSFQA